MPRSTGAGEKPIHLIGMAFGRKKRNLLDIRVETL